MQGSTECHRAPRILYRGPLNQLRPAPSQHQIKSGQHRPNTNFIGAGSVPPFSVLERPENAGGLGARHCPGGKSTHRHAERTRSGRTPDELAGRAWEEPAPTPASSTHLACVTGAHPPLFLRSAVDLTAAPLPCGPWAVGRYAMARLLGDVLSAWGHLSLAADADLDGWLRSGYSGAIDEDLCQNLHAAASWAARLPVVLSLHQRRNWCPAE